MPAFLLLTLHAPMASWGDIAVGERRGTWRTPSRSAVLGLCGAALGLRRDDHDAQAALARGYRIAVRVDAGGSTAEDYHTVQTVTATNVRRAAPATRAELLAHPDRETILSRRRYLENSLVTVAVWALPDVPWRLETVAAALRAPTFVPYAGRKAQPLGLPMRPEVLEAESLAAAFAMRPAMPAQHALLREIAQRLKGDAEWGREVFHDPCDGFESGLVGTARREVRRDVPLTRTSAWQFLERDVHVSLLPAAPEAAA